GYQIQVAANRGQVMQDMRALAVEKAGAAGEGIAGNGWIERAAVFGAMKAASVLAKEGFNTQDRFDVEDAMNKNTAGAAIRAVSAGIDTTTDVMINEARLSRARIAAFDPLYGRFGHYQVLADAYSAAMDASGGFESQFYNAGVNDIDEYINLFVQKAAL